MHHGKFLCQAEQALGVSDEQVAFGIEAAGEFVDQALLFGFIEIHHDVAAEDDIVALWQVFGLEVVKVEVDEFLDGLLDGIALAQLVEVAQAVVVVDRGHLRLGVDAFLTGAQHRVADVAGQDFELPRRRNQRLGQRHLEGQGIAHVVISQAVGDQHDEGVGFLPGGAAGAPDADGEVAALLLAAEQVIEDVFLKEIELSLVTEEAGFVDGKVFEQLGEFALALIADEQAVIAVEGVELALLEASLQAVLQEMGAAFVEVHAALLVDEGLQEFELGFGELGVEASCAHAYGVVGLFLFMSSPSACALGSSMRRFFERRFFRRYAASSCCAFDPRLAPWAAFLRRFAAENPILLPHTLRPCRLLYAR